MNRITIYDIATHIGVAPSTVSKVLNNYTGVSSHMRTLVEKACLELDYIPNGTAQSLIRKHSKMIGVVFSDSIGLGLEHPHFGQILQGFKNIIEQQGYDLLLINSHAFKTGYYEHCLRRQVDGCIVAIPKNERQSVLPLIQSNIPCVSVEDIYEEIPAIISDNYGGTLQILSHLYGLNHRKIAYISGPLDSLSGQERFQGYKDFMLNQELTYLPNLVVEAEDYNKASGYAAAEKLLAQCWQNMPTAIATAYDDFAYAVHDVLEQRGFNIPNDISITGFDNLYMNESITPKLTTIAQKRHDIGEKAGTTLLNMIEGQPVDGNVQRIPTELLFRSTTKRVQTND